MPNRTDINTALSPTPQATVILQTKLINHRRPTTSDNDRHRACRGRDALVSRRLSRLEDALQTLLEYEREAGSWRFDDTALDSGRFGELVSREFVTQTDTGPTALPTPKPSTPCSQATPERRHRAPIPASTSRSPTSTLVSPGRSRASSRSSLRSVRYTTRWCSRATTSSRRPTTPIFIATGRSDCSDTEPGLPISGCSRRSANRRGSAP